MKEYLKSTEYLNAIKRMLDCEKGWDNWSLINKQNGKD